MNPGKDPGLDPRKLLDPIVFVQVMEEYGIKPKDLGISRNYKYLLKKGERRPSKQLVEKLINLILNNNQNEDMGARSSAWWSARLITGRSGVRIPPGPLLSKIFLNVF